MSTYESRLKGCEQVADGTFAFHFEKPAGFHFKPGQAVDLVLPDPAPASAHYAARHTFSLVSAPFQDELVIATRMRDSPFKRVLKSLSVGAIVRLEGPFGSLTLHGDRARPAVLIAGGIGVTPFVSMLRQAAREQLPQRIVLLYANRRPEDAAFLAELTQLEQRYKYFHLIATMTQVVKSASPWDGSTGQIDEDMVRRACSEYAAPVYYVAGPPGMVESMRNVLSDLGVNDDAIRSEEFFGY
ncbi:ferredoxin--NADP reductase [Cupriavidus necator]|uniref:ferredoxin--NADP reductase n=1 Tax=Cupriavidus necator TaxID=106590 RepID=UPI0005B4E16B|nr:FAD-dependent oxidoreductase [Cupriavidus necator]